MRHSGENGTIPDGWQVVRLGDVAEVVGGSTPSRRKAEFWDGTIPWVVPSELTNLTGRYLTASKESITEKGMQAAGLRLIPAGSILLTSRATIGVTAINALPLVTNQGFQNLVVNGRADTLWLYYCASQQQVELQKRASGSTFKEVSRDSVRSLPILLPPLPEQRSIAAVLDSIDDAIERTDAVIAATEQLRDSLLHELLTRGVPGWHTEWKEVPGIGTIPSDWEVVRLGDVAEVNARSWDPSEGDNILYLDLTAVIGPGVLASPRDLSAPDAPSRARRRVQAGDILVSTVRPNLRGFARVASAPRNLIASTGFAVVTPKRTIDNSLLYHHVMTNQFANYLEGCTTGQAYPAVRPGDVASFRFAAPPLPEQRAIGKLLDRMDEAIEQEREEYGRLQSLMGSLANGLLTGQVRVEEGSA